MNERRLCLQLLYTFHLTDYNSVNHNLVFIITGFYTEKDVNNRTLIKKKCIKTKTKVQNKFFSTFQNLLFIILICDVIIKFYFYTVHTVSNL